MMSGIRMTLRQSDDVAYRSIQRRCRGTDLKSRRLPSESSSFVSFLALAPGPSFGRLNQPLIHKSTTARPVDAASWNDSSTTTPMQVARAAEMAICSSFRIAGRNRIIVSPMTVAAASLVKSELSFCARGTMS